MSESPIKKALRYRGNGDSVVGVPMRDLFENELYALGGEDWLLTLTDHNYEPLYERIERKAKSGGSENKALVPDESKE